MQLNLYLKYFQSVFKIDVIKFNFDVPKINILILQYVYFFSRPLAYTFSISIF